MLANSDWICCSMNVWTSMAMLQKGLGHVHSTGIHLFRCNRNFQSFMRCRDMLILQKLFALVSVDSVT